MRGKLLIFLFLLFAISYVAEAATISGQVKDKYGNPVWAATVIIKESKISSGGYLYSATTDDKGKYVLENIPQQKLSFIASYGSSIAQTKVLEVTKAQHTLDFQLDMAAVPGQEVVAPRETLPPPPSAGKSPTTLPDSEAGRFVTPGYFEGLLEKAKTDAFRIAGVSAAKNKIELSKIQGKACSSHGDCEGGVCINGACQPKPGDALCVESDVGLAAEKDNPNVKAGIVVNGIPRFDACGCEYPQGQFTEDCEKLGKPFTHVRETSCSEGQGKVVACENGCGEGACIKEIFMCNTYTTMKSNSGKIISCEKENKICRTDALGMNKCFVEDNYAVLADLYSSFDAYQSTFVFQPEYEKNLNTFLVSNIEISNLGLQYELLRLLPGYTKLILIGNYMGKDVLNSIPPNLKYEFIDVRKNLDIYKKKGIPLRSKPFTLTTDPWAQDLGEGNDKIFYISATRWSWSENYGLIAPDNDYLFDLKNAGIQVVRLPIMFEGGNINLAKNNKGEKIVFIGEDVVFITHEIYKKYEFSASYSATEVKVKEVLKKAFNADKVVIVKDDSADGEQPSLMFHIDQAFVFLHDGLVGLARITDIDDVKAEIQRRAGSEDDELKQKYQNLLQAIEIRQQNTALITGGGVKIVPKSGDAPKTSIPGSYKQISEIVGAYLALQDYEKILRDNGFEIVYLDTNAENALFFKAYTNLVVYKDREKNSEEIIMPFFAESTEQDILWNTNKDALSGRGFNVRGVEDTSFLYKGNIHCLSGLLAHVDEPCSIDIEASENSCLIPQRAGKPVGGLAKTGECSPTCKDDFILMTAGGEKDCWKETAFCDNIKKVCKSFDDSVFREYYFLFGTYSYDTKRSGLYSKIDDLISRPLTEQELLVLIHAFQDEDQGVRYISSNYILGSIQKGTLHTQKVIEKLTSLLLYHESRHVRREAARALGAIGDIQSIEPLGRALLNDPVVSLQASWALAQIKDERILSPLLQAAKNSAYMNKEAAILLLQKSHDVWVQKHPLNIVSNAVDMGPEATYDFLIKYSPLFNKISKVISYIDVDKKLERPLSPYEKKSITYALYRRIIKQGHGLSDLELSGLLSNEEINQYFISLLTKRKEFEAREILGPRTYVIQLVHEESRFQDGPLKFFAKERGVTRIYPETLKGPAAETPFLESIANSGREGPTTIWIHTHGSIDKLSLDVVRKADITYQELAEALAKRGNLHEVNVVLGSCFGYDFAENVNQYLEDKGVTSLPVIITAANKGRQSFGTQESSDSRLLASLKELEIPEKIPLFGKDFYAAEKNAYSIQDSSIFFSSEEIALNSLNHDCYSCQGDSCPLETAVS